MKHEIIFVILAEISRLLLGVAITSINAITLYIVLTKNMPEVNKDLVIAIVSATGMAQGTVLQYYFGSSAGSAAKDRIKQNN